MTNTDRIQTAHLISHIRSNLNFLMEPFMFEVNDLAARRLLDAQARQFLWELRERNVIHDFQVVCGQVNNTPERIDQGELHIDVYVQPVMTADFIRIGATLSRTGLSFGDLVDEQTKTLTLEDIKKLDHFKGYEEQFIL